MGIFDDKVASVTSSILLLSLFKIMGLFARRARILCDKNFSSNLPQGVPMNARFVRLFTVLLSLASASAFAAGKYDSIKQLSRGIHFPTLEIGHAPLQLHSAPVAVDMTAFYSTFDQQDEIKMYVGMGAQFDFIGTPQMLLTALQTMITEQSLPIANLALNANGNEITFTETTFNKNYRITFGSDRTEFINAFASYPIVVYTGHSRYGRGPTFGEMSNYFRLGNVFPTLEVDVRNPYFLNEPMQDLGQYPIQIAAVGGQDLEYQYIGQKDPHAELPADAYTKVIEGGPKDFDTTPFMDQKQIVFIWSCSNSSYFKEPIRDRFTTDDKLIFGTDDVPDGNPVPPLTVFITSLVKHVPNSTDVVNEFNLLQPGIFTAY